MSGGRRCKHQPHWLADPASSTIVSTRSRAVSISILFVFFLGIMFPSISYCLILKKWDQRKGGGACAEYDKVPTAAEFDYVPRAHL
jgi:hypothetical protein